MDKRQLDEILDQMLVEAPGDEHERLKSALGEFANSKGFSVKYARLPSGIPDVLLGTDHAPAYLFVGDAKDSANETPDIFATWERFRGYVRDFGTLIGRERIRGGIIAVATNSRKAAERWVPYLNAMADSERLRTGDAPPAFQITPVDANTFIVHW